MKRWEYNTLRGEIILFFIYLGIMVFEVMAAFYIIFFSRPVAVWIADVVNSPESIVILTWLGRFLVVVYMLMGIALFAWFGRKNDKI